jgi:hypothetical protein
MVTASLSNLYCTTEMAEMQEIRQTLPHLRGSRAWVLKNAVFSCIIKKKEIVSRRRMAYGHNFNFGAPRRK